MRTRFLGIAVMALALALPVRAQEISPLDATIKQLDLNETTVGDALRFISQVAGINMVATPEAASVEVTVLLCDLTVRQALEAICKLHGLWFRTEGAVVRVMTAEEFQRGLTVVREPRTQIFNLLHPNPVSVAYAIRDLFGARVLLSLGAPDDNLGTGAGSGLSGSGTTGQATGLGGSLNGAFSTPSGGGFDPRRTEDGSGGGGGGGRDARRDASERVVEEALAPTQLERIREQDGRVVSELRDLTEGLPMIAVTVNRRNNLVVVRTSDHEALAEIENLVLALDQPTPQVLLEMKVLEVVLDDGFHSVLDVDYVTGPTRQNLPTGKEANPFLSGAATALEQLAGAGNFPVTGGALIYQFLNDHVRVRLQMLEQENRLSVLATPLLLCANAQVSRIFIGEERPLVRNFQLQTTTTQGVATNQVVPTVELRDIGNTLRVLPRINADRTVTLTIVQDISTLNRGGASLPVPTANGSLQTFAVDTVNTANLEGTVVAKDGLTLAVGGLIRKELSDRQQGIPYLMDLPWIGWLFGETERSEQRRELVLLITPHVLMTPAEGHARTAARMRALSLHPYHDHGDDALNRYDLSDVPGAEDYRLLVEDYLFATPEPIR